MEGLGEIYAEGLSCVIALILSGSELAAVEVRVCAL